MKKKLILLSLFALTLAHAESVPRLNLDLPKPVLVACVGDSITFGVGTTHGNAYPGQLSRMLGRKYLVANFGVSGATLLKHGDKPYQEQRAFKSVLTFQPDIVVIKLGTNDTKPQNWAHRDEFVADYEDLIHQFAALPSKPRIFICRPAFVPGEGNYGINEKGVLAEIPLLDTVAAAEKVGVIDLHAALQPHPEMLPDRVHPNDQGAAVMARTVYQALTGKEYAGGDTVMKLAPAGH
jgi:acyl-CoA thioesterase I